GDELEQGRPPSHPSREPAFLTQWSTQDRWASLTSFPRCPSRKTFSKKGPASALSRGRGAGAVSREWPSAFLAGNFLPFLPCLGKRNGDRCLRLFTLPPLPPRPLLAVHLAADLLT